MKTTFAAIALVTATLFTPFVVHAEDSDADRKALGAFVKDSVITSKVKTRLAGEKPMTLAKVHVDTDRNGMVVLSGSVRTQETADKAVEIARATEGVTSVKSAIVVKKDD